MTNVSRNHCYYSLNSLTLVQITAMDQLSFAMERKMVEVSVVPVNGMLICGSSGMSLRMP